MPKSLHISNSKLKRPKSKHPHPPRHFASIATHILFGCKHPKTPSSAVGRNPSHGHPEIKGQMESPRGLLFDSPRLMLMMDPPKNLRGSHRFFVTTGASSSLAEEARLSSSASTQDGVAVPVYSPDPYDEFYRSIVEMVASRLDRDLTVDRDYMEELMRCYFDLNETTSYKYIMRAFVDVMEGLRQISRENPAVSRKIPAAGGRRRKRRECMNIEYKMDGVV